MEVGLGQEVGKLEEEGDEETCLRSAGGWRGDSEIEEQLGEMSKETLAGVRYCHSGMAY